MKWNVILDVRLSTPFLHVGVRLYPVAWSLQRMGTSVFIGPLELTAFARLSPRIRMDASAALEIRRGDETLSLRFHPFWFKPMWDMYIAREFPLFINPGKVRVVLTFWPFQVYARGIVVSAEEEQAWRRAHEVMVP